MVAMRTQGLAQRLGWAAWAWLACLPAQAAVPLTVLVEGAPPFVQERDGPPAGPYVDAFQRITAARGINSKILAIPVRRALVMAQQTPNTCVLALNYSQSTAEVLLYVGRVAPMYIWAYARHEASLPASTLSDLKHYQVGIIDIAEVRQLLDEAGVRYEALPQASRGLQMLQAKRFDVLLADVGPELAAGHAGIRIDKLFTATRVERWLACNPRTDPATLGLLRQSMKEGLFTEQVKDIWSHYGLDAYYQQVRQEWVQAKP